MDEYNSLKFRQITQYQNQGNTNNQGQADKRPHSGIARLTGPKHQRINHLTKVDSSPDQDTYEYQTEANQEADDINDDLVAYDQVHFLGTTLFYRLQREQLQGETLNF